MQRCSKFQFQSKILERKTLFVLFCLVAISLIPYVQAQEDLDALIEKENAVLIEQQQIIFEAGRHSDIIVKHVIEVGEWNEDRPRILEIIPGEHSNVSVVDEDGYRFSFSHDKESFEESKYIILKQKLGNYDLIIEYTMENFLELDNEMWKKKLDYTHDVVVMFEDEISLIFINSRPIEMIDSKGINCIGCNMVLEFLDDEEYYFIDIPELEISVDVLSNGKIDGLEFSEEKKLLNFDVEEKDQIFVLKIPFQLMLNPFDVYFTEKDDGVLDQIDKLRKTEFGQDDNHVFLSFRTFHEGVVSILGGTLDEHEKKLNQIKKMKSSEVESQIVEKEKGLSLPLPGQLNTQNSGSSEVANTPKLSFQDELEKGPSVSNNDNLMIFVIVGVIAVVIIGLIFKFKK